MSTAPQPETFTLMRAGANDLDDVMTIMTHAFSPEFGEAWTRSQCAGILPMSGVVLILARAADGRPKGFALMRTVADEAELLLLAVLPECRGHGIGRALIDDFARRAVQAGANRLHLEVRDGNAASHVYQKAGFRPAGRRRQYYRGYDGSQFDAITMVWCSA